MALFFVGGIYGAGKSDLCKELSRTLKARHLTASELIRYRPSPDDPTGKAVTDLEDNQRRLVVALRLLSPTLENVLLDGHFTLLARDGNVAPVPLKTFVAINPRALVLVTNSPSEVKRRLESRDEDRVLDLDLLMRLAKEERDRAEYVSASLGRPLKVVRGANAPEEAFRFLEPFLREVHEV